VVSDEVRPPRDKIHLTAKPQASSQVGSKIRIHVRQARTRPARIGTVGVARCEGTGGAGCPVRRACCLRSGAAAVVPVLPAPALAQTVVMTDS
jgi:hypothetical protein